MSKETKALIRIVQKRAGEPNIWHEAQTLINGGADIRAPTKTGPMIQSVIAEEKRHRQPEPWKAENCRQLIQVLQNRASDLLANQVLSSANSDINEMRQLVQLNARTYQSEKYKALGLLGELLKQDKTPIRLEVMQLLVEGDPNGRVGLTSENEAGQTCLSIARGNPQCPKEVINYLQRTFDDLLNKSPFAQPPIEVSEIAAWIRRGANPEATNEKGNTVLLNAVLTNNLELVRTLTTCGCNTAHTNAEQLTALEIAKRATPRNPKLVAALQAQNVNAELKQLIETKKAGLTVDEVSTLLAKGANINALTVNNNSPLHLLITNKGTPALVTAFVNDFNADITMMNTSGQRPIETCILVEEEPFAVLKTFLKLPKVSTSLFFNQALNKSLLRFAIDQKRTGAAQLIQHELNERLWACVAQANTKNEHNQNIMAEVKLLTDLGTQIQYKQADKDYQEWTVLHLACRSTTLSFVRFLIKEMKADYLKPNHNGDYPIAIAAEFGQLTIVEYLKDLPGSTLTVTNKDLQTPLHLATKNHHLLVARFLVLWGVDHQSKNAAKQTALDIAKTNTAKTKEDQLNDNKLISFLEQLICPPVELADKKRESGSMKPRMDLDTCELVNPVALQPVQPGNTDPQGLGMKNLGILAGNPNSNMHSAAKIGSVMEVTQAIGQGADICYRKNNRTAYQVAAEAANDYYKKLQSPYTGPEDRPHLQMMMLDCQQIISTIRQIAQTKLIEAIDRSDAGLVMAYHQAGAPLTDDLLYRACYTSDNVEIVDYLIRQSPDMYQLVFNYNRPDSPYRTAKQKQFNRIASHLKYLLSVECTKAVKANNLALVKQLIQAGASVDMPDTSNLSEALKHQNTDLVQLLCESGAKMPGEWSNSPSITLPADVARSLSPEIVLRINRYLINRRLRFLAASGDLAGVLQCQRLGADINSINCHGSTAVFCSIRYGNYFPIVHSLVSSGASMLHSNDNEPMSLIDLAKTRQYDQIANYLMKELNGQFITSILNNDQKSAEKFAQLGVDFNYQDEQKRTALHYAVQYYGIDLVKWLCDCGSSAMLADINGDYPIILATEKGDYAVVKLFVTSYPATRTHTNKAGLTALQIAQKLKYKRIAQLIETGKAVAESADDGQQPPGPKHTREELLRAAKNGPVKTIQEFRADRYDSREVKRQLCYEMVVVAKKAKQFEIVDILEPYYKNELKSTLPSDIEMGGNITLNDRYKKILLGFLTGLSSIIAESSVVLDPADPNTYVELFSGLKSTASKRSKELQEVNNEQDAKKLGAQDSAHTQQQLTKISEDIQKLVETKNELMERINQTTQRLSKRDDSSALERQNMFREQEIDQKQLAIYDCSLTLYQRQQEATLNRQHTINFIKGNINLYLFYRTIENRLQSLFHSVLAAQSGMFTVEKQGKYGLGIQAVNAIPIPSMLGLSDSVVGSIKSVVSSILSKLDEKAQKKEWDNISTLGNIGELDRAASDTAGLMTLYFREQIQSIDSSGKIKGSNMFNDKIKWIKDVFVDVRPEANDEMAVIMVAEYVTAWIIDALKGGKEQGIQKNEPLSQQLWFCVAKTDPVNQGTLQRLSDVVGVDAGRQKIPLTMTTKDKTGNDVRVSVQLRYLIGCVSVVDISGQAYQFPVPGKLVLEGLEDLNVYGYVYISAFSSDEKVSRAIIDGRKLIRATLDADNNIQTRVEEIKALTQTYHPQGTEKASQSFIMKETANQVAEVLREQKVFLDSKAVREELEAARKKTELSVDVLKEEIQTTSEKYQTSIDAAHEQIKVESTKNLALIKRDNEERYDQATTKLLEQLKQFETNMEKKIDQRMNEIQEEMRTKTKEMLKIAEEARAQSIQALSQSTAAAQASDRTAKEAGESAKLSQKLVDSTEQRRLELQSTANQCEAMTKKVTAEQKELFERSIAEIRAKIQQDFEQTKQAATQSASSAKESSRAAQEAAAAGRETAELTKKELSVQKKESERILAEAKRTREESERSAQLAKDAEREARRAADASTKALERVEKKLDSK